MTSTFSNQSEAAPAWQGGGPSGGKQCLDSVVTLASGAVPAGELASS